MAKGPTAGESKQLEKVSSLLRCGLGPCCSKHVAHRPVASASTQEPVRHAESWVSTDLLEQTVHFNKTGDCKNILV